MMTDDNSRPVSHATRPLTPNRKHSGRREPTRRAHPSAEALEPRQLLAVITVNSAGDADGADGGTTLSLRQAIEVSNGTLALSALSQAQAALVAGALSSPNTIGFAIPGTGPFVIMPATALPAITSPVVIDGYSQPGAHPNTNGPGQGLNADILIEIDGARAPGANGLDLRASNSTVEGLAIGGFTAAKMGEFGLLSGGDGILIESATGDAIQGNFIGTDTTGTQALPNALGIDDENGPLTGSGIARTINTIGGTAPGAGNLISGNAGNGLGVQGNGMYGNPIFLATDLIQGNQIGTDASGTKPLSNVGAGIADSGGGSTIGGTGAGSGNLISGNGGSGLIIGGFDVSFGLHSSERGSDDLIEGNLIGTDVTGLKAVPNGNDGITADSGTSTVGGTTAGAGNVIANNGAVGVNIVTPVPIDLIHTVSTPSVLVSGNSIFANVGGGIVPNTLLKAPLITSVTPQGSGSEITGTLDEVIATNAPFVVELFSNATPDPSGLGQGQTYLGSVTVQTDAMGNASFTFDTAAPLKGQAVSATASNGGNTSAFARDVIGYTATPTTTTTTLALGAGSTLIAGQPVTLVATVASTSGTPTGLVDFFAGAGYLGSANVGPGGEAVFVDLFFPPGASNVTAVYKGDASHGGSRSPTLTVTVATPVSVDVLGPNRVATQGQPLTFSAQATAGVPLAGASIAFFEDGNYLGSALSGPDGVATLVTDQLAPGPHVITAATGGNSLYLPSSSSNAIAVEVTNVTAFGGPSVTSDTLVGPTEVVVRFNRGLLMGPAEDLANYKLVGPHGKAVAIASAVYNPADASVTLTTEVALDPHDSYELTINGQTGERVVDVFGIALNGQKQGKPGHNYEGKVAVKKPPVVKVVHPKAPPKPKAHAAAHKKGH